MKDNNTGNHSVAELKLLTVGFKYLRYYPARGMNAIDSLACDLKPDEGTEIQALKRFLVHHFEANYPRLLVNAAFHEDRGRLFLQVCNGEEMNGLQKQHFGDATELEKELLKLANERKFQVAVAWDAADRAFDPKAP